MAGTDGPTTDSLVAALAERPFAYDFNAAVRLLQSHFAQQPRIGYSSSPKQDPVRFAQSPALDFAPSTIEALRRKDPARPPVFYARHFGLFGPHGPLPLCLTEYARERILHHGDETFAAFCNIFHHRLMSFFFRAWADAQKTVDLDRRDDQHWSSYLGGITGLGLDSLLERDSVPDRAKLYFAGRMVHQTRNAEGLEAIIQDFFSVPTELHTFIGRWLKLPTGSHCRLGGRGGTGTLGTDIIVGSRIWTCQLHFRLRLGPVSLADLERFLPTGASFRRLRDWIRYYAGEHFSWDAQLVLHRDQVPHTRLGRAGQLGWTTWLKTQSFQQDPQDLILIPPETP